MVKEIVVPQLGVNDEFVKIVEWYREEGEQLFHECDQDTSHHR